MDMSLGREIANSLPGIPLAAGLLNHHWQRGDQQPSDLTKYIYLTIADPSLLLWG